MSGLGSVSPSADRAGDRAEEIFFPVPMSDDRIEIIATIVYTRFTETDFASTWKGLFICEGELGRFKLWGLIPSAIDDELLTFNTIKNFTVKGSLVTFWARVERGKKNDYSGFFSRPSKARILVPGINGREQ